MAGDVIVSPSVSLCLRMRFVVCAVKLGVDVLLEVFVII